MKIQIHNWQHKADILTNALKDAGVEIVKSKPDIYIIDFDGAVPYYTSKIEKAYQQGAEIVIYTHGAPVNMCWDRVWTPDDRVRVYLAQSKGEKAIMQSYDYPKPIEVIGWHYCRTKKYKPVKEIKRVLFAPWHPHDTGYLMPLARQINGEIFNKLRATPYELTVMHVESVRANGLSHDSGVTYVESKKTVDFSLKYIDQADVVVSNLMTVASLAVARGKPMVAYGQDIRPHDGYDDDNITYVKNWDKYRDMLRYPYDISNLKPKASQNLIEYAAQNEAKEWREKFIGEQLDKDKLLSVLNNILEVDSYDEIIG